MATKQFAPLDEATFLPAKTEVTIAAATERELQEFARARWAGEGFDPEGWPGVAGDAHSADPHYSPPPEGGAVVGRGSLLLLDFSASAISSMPEPPQCRITNAVRSAGVSSRRARRIWTASCPLCGRSRYR